MNNPGNTFDASKLTGIGIKPLVSLRKHARTALIMFILVFLIGIPIAWIKGNPKYLATATFQIMPRYMKNMKEDIELEFQSNSQYREFVTQQMRTINRYDVVEQALIQLGDKRGTWQKSGEKDRKAIERLMGELLVTTIPDTYMVQVGLQGPRPDGLDLIVNAVVLAYFASARDEQMYGADDRIKRVLEREKVLLRDIKAKLGRRTVISLELGVTNFSEALGSPYDKLLADSRSALVEARNQRYQAQSRRNAFVANGETDIASRSLRETILGDPGLTILKATLSARRAALFLTLSGLTPSHPAALAARAEMSEIDAEIAAETRRLTREVTGNLRTRYAMSIEQAQTYEQNLEKVLREQQDASENFARLFNEAVTLTSDMAQSRKELETVRDRLNFFAAERGSIGFVHMVTPALPSDTPFGPGHKKLLLLALAAALVLGLLTPIAIDLLNRRIRSVSDAERTLGLPALGWLVERSGVTTETLAEDQLRRIAAGLLRERERHESMVFGICGVKPGAGASGIALKLAAVLTEMGFPTLAVEANAFSADKRFESGRPGLAQCLAGSAAAMACVEPADARLPARVQVGTSGLQHHLGNLDRLDAALAEWRRQFSFVLVDMPPLLLSADAEILINRLGTILLIVEANAINKGELARAARMLEGISTKAVGVIVNRIEPLDGGGYLHDMMIEQVSRRKMSDFQSLPAWKLRLQIMMPQIGQRLIARFARLKKRLQGGKLGVRKPKDKA